MKDMEGSVEVKLHTEIVQAQRNKSKLIVSMETAKVGAVARQSLLNGVLSHPVVAPVGARSFRRYKATFSSDVTMGGAPDGWSRNIGYEIGSKDLQARTLFHANDAAVSLDGSHDMSNLMAGELAGLAKKYSNFSGEWKHADFSAIVYKLAIGAAACSWFDDVSTEDMRGGLPVSVTVLGNTFTPVSASENQVFIPRMVDSVLAPDVLAVLIAAVNGSGGTVVTDLLEVDMRTNSVIVPTVRGARLGAACVSALHLLGANYDAASAGAIYALALTKGIHHVVSVVGHGDECGFVRSVFRRCDFNVPYGGIHSTTQGYLGVPGIARPSKVAMCGWVDSIALVTAALVAESDPGVVIDGDWFPTVFVSGRAPRARAGDNTPGTAEMARDLSTMIGAECGNFVRSYVRNLADCFCLSGGEGKAESILSAMFINMAGRDERHLRFPVVAPFNWIEPTSLIPFGRIQHHSGSGSGALVSPGGVRTVPLFEQAEMSKSTNTDYTRMKVKIRSARSCGLLVHLAHHPVDGLGCIRVKQVDPEGIVLPGGRPNRLTIDLLEAGLDIGSLLWVRGQSKIVSPCELLNIRGGLYGLVLRHKTSAFEDVAVRHEHLPRQEELGGCVTYRVSRPNGCVPGDSNQENTQVARCRSSGSLAMAEARGRLWALGSAVDEPMPVALSVQPFSNTKVAERLAVNSVNTLNEAPGGHEPIDIAAERAAQERQGEARDLPVGGAARLVGVLGPNAAPRPPPQQAGGGAARQAGVVAHDGVRAQEGMNVNLELNGGNRVGPVGPPPAVDGAGEGAVAPGAPVPEAAPQ